MATPEKTVQADTELHELAFQIYCHRVAAQPINRAGAQIALDAFRKAEEFIAMRDQIESGEVSTAKPTESPLADCCAPNLPRTHPHNLVSQRFGDVNRVKRINDWFAKNPAPVQRDDEPQYVDRVRTMFPELGWDMPTINVARVIFPAYCG